ncbi:MAG TPA: class I SAM-dependent methyltransferase [Ktedonobacterales bacterium]|nr:class I SAM-dependent methyltransferase [Ktedonobacterales bacterium]
MQDTSPDQPTPFSSAQAPSAANSSPNISGSLSFDRVAHIYDETRGYPLPVAREIARALMAYGPFPPQSSVLEIGIGTGRIALPLLEGGVNITGVDISAGMVARLRAKYDAGRAALPLEATRAWGALHVELADMTALPFANATFDGVVAVHVLHLVPAWRQAFAEALRVIRPGGALLIGQDVTHGDALNHIMQDEWVAIVERLGADTSRLGAAGYREILQEARQRGLSVTEQAVATWTDETTPRQALAALAQREWSRTWNVPDDLFGASLQELTTWVEERYAGAMDTPQPGLRSFKVGRIG